MLKFVAHLVKLRIWAANFITRSSYRWSHPDIQVLRAANNCIPVKGRWDVLFKKDILSFYK